MPTKPQPQITCPDHCVKAGSICKHALLPEKEGGKTMCAHENHFLCTEALKYEPSRVSHSAIMDNLRCHKLDFFKNVGGVEPVEEFSSEAIKMGNRWEAKLEEVSTSTTLAMVKYSNIYLKNQLSRKNEAIMSAFHKAYKELNLTIPAGNWQEKRIVGLEDYQGQVHPVSCVFDVVHPDTNSFSEIKMTSDFKYYDNTWSMRDQVGLYFVLNPEMEYCTMYVVQKPAKQVGPYKPSKTGKGGVNGESIEAFEDRMFNTFIGNPRAYFLDYRVDTSTSKREWGRKFYRSMFNLEEIRRRAIDVSQLRMRSARNDYWQENSQSCFMYGEDCEFKPICMNGGCMTEGFRVKTIKLEEK